MTRLAIVIALVTAAGCSSVALVDDVDLDLDFNLLTGPSNDLHSPYVVGAGMTVFVRYTGSGQDELRGWTLQSSDPSVFTVGARKGGTGFAASGTAVGPGVATLTVRNQKGEVEDAQQVEVKVPDRAQVLAHGPLLLGRPDGEALLGQAQIEVGGTATFLVRWFAGATLLAGNGVLSTQAASDVVARAETTSFFEERDWLQVQPQAVGARTISLFAGGHQVSDFSIVGVAPSSVARVELQGQDETHASNGTSLVVLAKAFDSSGAAIFGIDYSWDVDGAAESGLGDLYRYQVQRAQPKMLTAHHGAQQGSAAIHAGHGYVDSTNHLGCSTSGRTGSHALTLLGVGLALLITRRRARH